MSSELRRIGGVRGGASARVVRYPETYGGAPGHRTARGRTTRVAGGSGRGRGGFWGSGHGARTRWPVWFVREGDRGRDRASARRERANARGDRGRAGRNRASARSDRPNARRVMRARGAINRPRNAIRRTREAIGRVRGTSAQTRRARRDRRADPASAFLRARDHRADEHLASPPATAQRSCPNSSPTSISISSNGSARTSSSGPALSAVKYPSAAWR